MKRRWVSRAILRMGGAWLGLAIAGAWVGPTVSMPGADRQTGARPGVGSGLLAASLQAQGAPVLSGNLRLVASQSLSFTTGTAVVVQHPGPVTQASGFVSGSPLFQVVVPADRSRSHLLALANASYIRHQVPGALVRFSGALTVVFESPILPSPGTLDVMSVGTETLVEESGPVSDKTVSYAFPYSRAVTIDAEALRQAIHAGTSPYLALSAEERDALAYQLLRSESRITVIPKVDMRSIDWVRFSPIRSFQLWGG